MNIELAADGNGPNRIGVPTKYIHLHNDSRIHKTATSVSSEMPYRWAKGVVLTPKITSRPETGYLYTIPRVRRARALQQERGDDVYSFEVDCS